MRMVALLQHQLPSLRPTPVTATIGVVTEVLVSCNGGNNGSATVTAGGGTPGYKLMHGHR